MIMMKMMNERVNEENRVRRTPESDPFFWEH